MREVIAQVDCLYAEDTRHTGKLCQHLGLTTKLRSLHDHNESDRVEELIGRLQSGENLGVVSDAGTPLISDPGYRIVAAAQREGIRVSPVAGPSAVIAALSVCGLPTDRFCFYGFLPAKAKARQTLLAEIAENEATSVVFESRHRIVGAMADICEFVGDQRQICVARELTKTFESVMTGPAQEVQRQIVENPDAQRGEFVVVIKGFERVVEQAFTVQTKALLSALTEEMAPRKAAAIVAQHTGANKKALYQWLIAQSDSR